MHAGQTVWTLKKAFEDTKIAVKMRDGPSYPIIPYKNC